LDKAVDRYPKAARLLRAMVAEEVETCTYLDPKRIRVRLRFASANSDAVVDVTVITIGEQWREPVHLATLESDLPRLRNSLSAWLAAIK